MAKLGETLFVLHVHGENFDNYSVHLTQEGAEAAVAAFVEEFWDQEMGDTDRDPDEFVEQYFEHVEAEEYHIEEAEIEA